MGERIRALAGYFGRGGLPPGERRSLGGRAGVVHIVDRWKDIFISSGENVLYQYPEVVLAFVVGTTHERWGEAGVAFVVLSERSDTTKDDLEQWCRTRLASYKIPHRFEFMGELPRNATGKILKNELRKAIL